MQNESILPSDGHAFQLSGELIVQETLGKAVWFNSKIICDSLKNQFNWLKNFLTRPKIPSKFTRTVDGTRIEIFYRYNEIFCCQIEEPDNKVAGCMWTTEIEIILQDDKVLLGVKVSYTPPESIALDSDKFRIPDWLQKILQKIVVLNGLSDVRELAKTVLRADSEESLTELYDLITNQNRICPVVVITDFVGDDGIPKPLVEPETLLKTVGLIAHVAYIPGDWTWQWTQMVESGWDVYKGAVRTYYKNVNFDNFDLRRHPLCTADWIFTREYKNLKGSAAFVALLTEKLQNNNRRVRLNWHGLGHKFLHAARLEDENIRDDEVRSRLDDYKKEIADLKSEQTYLYAENTRLENELTEKNTKIHSLQQRIERLKQKLGDAGKTEDIIPAKCTYKDIAQWVDAYFPTTLYLTDRAKRSLKEAAHPKTNAFADVELVYKWLQFLGTEYWQMRMGQLDKNSALEKAKELGIYKLDEPPIGDARRGEQGKKYYTKYNGANYEIDCHIKTGVGEPQYCLRIYYFWHDEDSVVVIADLPWHLDTRDT